jgi:hypothetical protein
MLVSSLAYSLTLKMEAKCFFETSVNFQWTELPPEREDTHHHHHHHIGKNIGKKFDEIN